MLKHILACCVTAFSPVLLAAGAPDPEITGFGTLQAIRIEGQRFAVTTGLDVAGPGWKNSQGLSAWNVENAKLSPAPAGAATYSGTIPFAASPVEYRQSFTTDQETVRLHLEVKPRSAAPAEGIRATVNVPVGDFAGGEARLIDTTAAPASATMPVTKPERQHFLVGQASGVEFRKDDRRLTVRFDRPRQLMVQDNRVFGHDEYSVYFMLHSGDLVAGQTDSAEMLISAEAPIDHAPVTLNVNPERSLCQLDGLGGNFVYSSESPSSIYNLDHLNVAWGRVWLPLHEWETANDNETPATTDLPAMAANDKPGTKLRYALEMARELEKRQIPYIASIWGVPQWLASNPGKPGENKHGIIIARDMWDELAESIGSYLLYARDKYGAQPEMFSFNEPDWGVTVKLTPEEHRDLIKLLGAHFQKLGLKTRMLAGDVTNPRNTAGYVSPTIDDPVAMAFVDAIAFHSWGGASPEQYRQWHEAAVKAGKPLMVTEAGVDAGAWRHSGVFKSYWFGHAEARQYLEMLAYARPQAILLWEYTDDYGLLNLDRKATPPAITPTKRFHFMRQLAEPTQRNSTIVETSSPRNDLLFVAARGKNGRLTLHILNDGAARTAAITGLTGRFTAYVTDQSRNVASLGDVDATIDLPAWSLVTLVQK